MALRTHEFVDCQEGRYRALTMPDEEACSRWEDLHNRVTTQTVQAFVTTFLNRCVRSNTEIPAQLEKELSSLMPRFDMR